MISCLCYKIENLLIFPDMKKIPNMFFYVSFSVDWVLVKFLCSRVEFLKCQEKFFLLTLLSTLSGILGCFCFKSLKLILNQEELLIFQPSRPVSKVFSSILTFKFESSIALKSESRTKKLEKKYEVILYSNFLFVASRLESINNCRLH